MPNPGHLNSILLLAGSHPSYKPGIASSSFFPYSRPTSPSPICPYIPDTSCSEGRLYHSTSGWVLPMIECPLPHNLHTSRSLPPAPAPPILIHISPPTPLSLSPFPLPHATFISNPSLPPTTLPRDTFAPNGYFPHIHHTSSSPPSSLAALLPFLAAPLYLDSPIGHALPLHTPNTLLAALFPHRGAPHFLPPSSYTPYLTRAQIYCSLLPTSFAFLPRSPFAYSGGPSGRTIHICDICGRLFSPSSFQCMPGYRALW